MAKLSEEQRTILEARAQYICRKARRDPVEFTKWVARIEGGSAIRVPDMHREWHQILSEHDQVVLFAPVGHGKTNQITRWRILWEIGKNPNIRVAIVSATEKLPKDVISGLRQDIEGVGPGSEWLRLIFPHLARRHWKIWSDDRLSLSRTDALAQPTISAYSPGKQILGSRFDIIVVDDIHDLKNTLTPEARDKMYKWLTGEVFSRDNPAGTRIWVIGHVWHEDDVLHRLAARPGFYSKLYKAYKIDEETGVEVAACPEVWTTEQLKKREANLGPIMSKIMLRNELIDTGAGRIKREYFKACLERGSTLGADFASHWNPNDSPTFTGVDLGFGGGALTSMFTATVLPDGTRRILEIRYGDWTGPEIIEQLKLVHMRFGSVIAVEGNGAQRMIEEFASELTSLPINKHITGMNRHHIQFGVESLAIELCNKKWMIPCDADLQPNDAVARWITECVGYSPETHPGDVAMSCWICREIIRKSGAGMGVVPESFFDVDTLAR